MSAELECGRDAAAYVLGALDSDEALAFRLHMAGCEACRDEVDLLESAAAALPMMVPQYPVPGTLRSNVMHEVRRDAMLHQASARSAPARPRRFALNLPGPAVAALGALLVMAMVTLYLSSRSAGTQVIRARTAWAPGAAVVELTGGHGELLVKGMPAPPAGKVYEVWVEHGSRSPSPTDALFDVNSAGEAAVDVPGRLGSQDSVLVTAEPAGGARVPTLPILIAARVT
jgi:anti-sigma-K factor RskA